MVGIAASVRASVAEIPGVGGGGIGIDQGAVGQEARGAVHAGRTAEKISRRCRVYMHRILYAVAASVQVGDHQFDDEITRRSVGVCGILLSAAVLGARRRIAKIPQPACDLPSRIYVRNIRKGRHLVLAVAPEGEGGERTVGNGNIGLVGRGTPQVVGSGETYREGIGIGIQVCDIHLVREMNGIRGADIAKSPNPGFQVTLPYIGAEVGKVRAVAQAVRGIKAKESRRMRQYIYRVRNGVLATIGIDDMQCNGIGVVGWIQVEGIEGRVGLRIGSIPEVPVAVADARHEVPR